MRVMQVKCRVLFLSHPTDFDGWVVRSVQEEVAVMC